MRVIADHIRAISFAHCRTPTAASNVKAGYVIRRILRRGVRYGYTFLGFREPFLHSLVPVLISQMGSVFPELTSQKDLIINVMKEEEAAFLRTLATGIQRFNSYLDGQSTNNGTIYNGQCVQMKNNASGLLKVHLLSNFFDTYGFPIDLTQLMAREAGWEVDMEGFRKGLEEQKARSRQAASVQTSDWVVLVEDAEMPEFVGYDTLKIETEITRYRKIATKGKELYHIVLGQTPFYGGIRRTGRRPGGGSISEGKKTEILDTVKRTTS